MPLYEYLCEACGRRTEALQRRDEPALVECPHCGGKLRKLLSAPAFQFKGSGWYLTDYARKSASGEKGGDAPSTGKGPAAASGGESGGQTGGEGGGKPGGEGGGKTGGEGGGKSGGESASTAKPSAGDGD